jgi:hypothetical protein
MTAEESKEREIRETLVAANIGEARADQLARLDESIRTDARLARYAAQLLDQQATLAWQGDRRNPSRPHAPAARTAGHVTRNLAPRPQSHGLGSCVEHGLRSAIPVLTAFLLGGVLATAVAYIRSTPAHSNPLDAAVVPRSTNTANYGARLVRSTACLWEQDPSGSPVLGSWLAGGESLHLVEGLAEFTFNWTMGGSATLSLEGPAAMMLGTEGMPTLRFGRLTATISARERPFVLETPVGRLVLNDYGSIGVSAFGNDAEIHVFDGSALLESAWPSSASRGQTPLAIKAGEALRITAGKKGELVVERHPAEKSYFVVQVSMASDALVVPASYVSAVKAAKPIGYWRMERDAWPGIPNEIESRFGCRVVGSLARTGHPGNQAVEFGVTDQGGEIISNEVLDDALRDSYSVEVWIKPSHYHMGALVSLIGQPETPAGVIPHAMLLELGGSSAVPTALNHPGRIRFLHRSPASDDTLLGTSCYSSESYTLRKWQHLVAVKDGSAMRLYINGELAGEGEDTSKLPHNLRLLVGRLYPERQTRPFKGQLDELALYDRALSVEEVRSHFQLMRPAALPVKRSTPAKPAI